MSILGNIGLSYFINLYLADNPVIKYFYNQLYSKFNPDVNGYTLAFMIPPDLSGLSEWPVTDPNTDIWSKITNFTGLTSEAPITFKEYSKMISFLATDFTPPQTQVQTAQIQTRSGAASYASDVITTETMSITYLEANPLVTYKFHLLWVEYIKQVIRGDIEPAEKYYDPDNEDYFGTLDYLASIYIVKYMQDMKTVSYVSKCTGVYPVSLPSKELIGSRNTNEITMLPFEYACVGFHEYVLGLDINSWLYDECTNFIQSNYTFSIL